MRKLALLTALFASAIPQVGHGEELGPCKFDPAQLKFAGTSIEQAKCLLRPVARGAALGPILSALPDPLDSLIGKPVTLSLPALRTYLAARNIPENTVGGILEAGVSHARSNDQDAPAAQYFVIHDTSYPNCSKAADQCAVLGHFPDNMNQPSWSFNDTHLVLRYDNGDAKAHVFIARTGTSKTGHDFEVPWRATQLESVTPGIPAKGLFLHVENVQPRVGDPAVPPPGGAANDRVAPVPGFTPAHYTRLAVVYVVASFRRKQWLIPAFHAVIDKTISNAHDDPQNFDLDAWAAALRQVLADISH